MKLDKAKKTARLAIVRATHTSFLGNYSYTLGADNFIKEVEILNVYYGTSLWFFVPSYRPCVL